MDSAVEDFGREYGYPTNVVMRAKRICYRTIWTECDWRNFANRSVPGSIDVLPNDGYPDHGGDQDSVGLYQQRAQWWGSTEGSMTPYTATMRFLDALNKHVGWFSTLDESDACQLVQQSQYNGVNIDPSTGQPYPYAANYRARTAQVDAIEEDELYFTNSR